jgi:hypothetical protein
MLILCLFYVNLCKKKKKTFYGQTDRLTIQNYSSEPHKKILSIPVSF